MCASPQSRGLSGGNRCAYLIGGGRAIALSEPHRVSAGAEARAALPKTHDSPVVAARMTTQSEPVSGSDWLIIGSEPVSGYNSRNHSGGACVPTHKCRDHLAASGAITQCEVGGCFHWSGSAGGASKATQLPGMVRKELQGARAQSHFQVLRHVICSAEHEANSLLFATGARTRLSAHR